MRDLRGLELEGVRVLLRCDFNVPLDGGGNVSDSSRIEAHVATIKGLCDRGARVMILSHLGRPKGFDERFSLRVLLSELERFLGRDVRWLGDVMSHEARLACESLGRGEVGIFENVRFHVEEESGDEIFARSIADLGDIFVGDAFSVSHRGHASVSVIGRYLPSYAGDLMFREVETLRLALGGGRGKTLAVVGGSKVSTKLEVLEGLLERVDSLAIMGAMAHTFLEMKGYRLGMSLVEGSLVEEARGIEEKARSLGVCLLLPRDVVVEGSGGMVFERSVSEIGDDESALDVGRGTLEELEEKISGVDKILWNGPLGYFEDERFLNGTRVFIEHMMRAGSRGCLTVMGGGDTIAALTKVGIDIKNYGGVEGLSYISLAGGAFLEWLEGRDLPGVSIL